MKPFTSGHTLLGPNCRKFTRQPSEASSLSFSRWGNWSSADLESHRTAEADQDLSLGCSVFKALSLPSILGQLKSHTPWNPTPHRSAPEEPGGRARRSVLTYRQWEPVNGLQGYLPRRTGQEVELRPLSWTQGVLTPHLHCRWLFISSLRCKAWLSQ